MHPRSLLAGKSHSLQGKIIPSVFKLKFLGPYPQNVRGGPVPTPTVFMDFSLRQLSGMELVLLVTSRSDFLFCLNSSSFLKQPYLFISGRAGSSLLCWVFSSCGKRGLL